MTAPDLRVGSHESRPVDTSQPDHGLNPADEAALTELAGRLWVRTDERIRRRYAGDRSNSGAEELPAAVVEPITAAEVSTALDWAYRHRVPVSVRGGGTGLSGGALACPGGMVISTARLSGLQIDSENLTARVGAGVVTADLDAAAAAHGLRYAPDPLSAERSTIGGNIATNAGGPRGLSQGVTADAVMALQVVLADGRIVRTGAGTCRNSTAYNLTGLFVGSEGTLGVVTEAVVRLAPRPLGTPIVFGSVFPGPLDAARAVVAIRNRCRVPESLELLDTNAFRAVAEQLAENEVADGSAVVIGEYLGGDAAEATTALLEICQRHRGTLMSGAYADGLLRGRLRLGKAMAAAGPVISCDVAVPLGQLGEMLTAIETISRDHGLRVSTTGHAGCGSLHSVVHVPGEDKVALDTAGDLVDDIIRVALVLGGVISGEHGVGARHRHHLVAQLDPASRSLQEQIKRVLDPGGILSPGRGV